MVKSGWLIALPGDSAIICTPTPHHFYAQVIFSTCPVAMSRFFSFFLHRKGQLPVHRLLNFTSPLNSAFELWDPAGLSSSQPTMEAGGNRAQG